MPVSIRLLLTPLGLSLLLTVSALAETSVGKPAVQYSGTFKSYLRPLAAEGDHVYVAVPEQCFQDLSLRDQSIRPVMDRCPSGVVDRLIVLAKRFYWTQYIPKGRHLTRLYTCGREHCAPRLLGELSSLGGIYYRDSQLYVSLSAPNRTSSTVIRIDVESGSEQTILKAAVPVPSLVVDGTDIYYYRLDKSAAIWRKSMTSDRRAEIVVGGAGKTPLLLARTWDEAEEIRRLPLMGHPYTPDFYRLLEVDGDRLYWESQCLLWWSKSQHSVTEFTDSDGKRLPKAGVVVPTAHYFYFLGPDGKSILRVGKRGGRPEIMAADNSHIDGVVVADGLLIWSVSFQGMYGSTTTIHWTALPAEN